jgi:hypothetical protein
VTVPICSPAGFYPAGFDALDEVPAPGAPRSTLADLRGARREVASLTRGAHPVDAAMEHAVAVRRFSGAALDAGGNTVHQIKLLGTGARSAIEADLRASFRWLVDAKHVEIERFEVVAGVDGDPTMSAVVVHYRNLRTGQQQKARRAVR